MTKYVETLGQKRDRILEISINSLIQSIIQSINERPI